MGLAPAFGYQNTHTYHCYHRPSTESNKEDCQNRRGAQFTRVDYNQDEMKKCGTYHVSADVSNAYRMRPSMTIFRLMEDENSAKAEMKD
jgi:hypothetical protein